MLQSTTYHVFRLSASNWLAASYLLIYSVLLFLMFVLPHDWYHFLLALSAWGYLLYCLRTRISPSYPKAITALITLPDGKWQLQLRSGDSLRVTLHSLFCRFSAFQIFIFSLPGRYQYRGLVICRDSLPEAEIKMLKRCLAFV